MTAFKDIEVLEDFHADNGSFIQRGTFKYGTLTRNHRGEECRLYTRENSNETIKLNNKDLERPEVKILQ